ncbi:MAG: type IV pilus biogenesis/stability protein PilW [Gammaproteobacteria bacterium]|nr:type IV pilus biogenesis/stability protein PilW [Gammaproteobacteria bacterium]
MAKATRYGVLAILLALQACTTTPEEKPSGDPAELNLQLGVAYLQQGRFDVALEKLQKSLSFREDYPEAQNAIAVLYDERGNTEMAEQHFQRAIKLDPNYLLAVKNYGQFLCRNQHFAEGEALFLGIVADKPAGSDEAYEAYVNAGICAMAVPDFERAEGYLRKALEMQPNGALALYRMAELSFSKGDYLQARAFLQRFHEQTKPSPESLWLGVNIEQNLGDERLRQEYTRRLLSLFPDSVQARRLKSS